MKNKIFIFVTIIFFISSCTDLDEKVYDKIPSEVYPENSDQVAGLSVGVYAELKPLGDDKGWWYLAQEISSNEIIFPVRGSDWYDGGKWLVMYQHKWTNDVEGVNNMWSGLFNGVTRANQIIDMMKLLEQSNEIIAKIKEVETMRAFYYYLIMDNFGDAPYLTSALNAPDQPLKIKRAAMFDSITTSVENSLAYLKPIKNNLMATRYMGFALLAKLYLNAEIYTGTAQWEKAGQYIDSLLLGPFSIDKNVLDPFKTTNRGSLEMIFGIDYNEDDEDGFRIHMRTLHYQQNLTFDMQAGPWNGCCVTYDHFKTYDSTDNRLKYFCWGIQRESNGDTIIENITKKPLNLNPYVPAAEMKTPAFTNEEIRTSGARIVKYEIEKGAKEKLNNAFVIFRLTDFILMKAEVELRTTGLQQSTLDMVNTLRTRANVPEYSLNELTLDELLKERGRELFAEGHRRQDLIRYGKFLESRWEKPVSTDYNGISRTIFPIPLWAKKTNPNL